MRVEEEEFLSIAVEVARDKNRPAHCASKCSEPVDRLGQPVTVVEEIVGVESLVTLVGINCPMVFTGTGFRHQADRRTRVAPVLRSVVVGNDLCFGHCIHAHGGHEKSREVRVRTHLAVYHHRVPEQAGAANVGCKAAELSAIGSSAARRIAGAHLAAPRVDGKAPDARQDAQQVHHVATGDGDIG